MGSKYQLATVCTKNELEDQAPHEIDHGIGMGLGMIFIHKNVSRTRGMRHRHVGTIIQFLYFGTITSQCEMVFL